MPVYERGPELEPRGSKTAIRPEGAPMLDPKCNPFFEQLKADIHAGIEQADRGETLPLEDSLARARAAVLKIADEQDAHQS
jgi:hypothetical protein